MCIFERIVYEECSNSRPYGPNPDRKCHLQFAYEHGETQAPRGPIAEHNYVSIRFRGRRRDCDMKIRPVIGYIDEDERPAGANKAAADSL